MTVDEGIVRNLRGSTIGIWAYANGPRDNFGGVETHTARLARELSLSGARVVVHCLAAERAGWHVSKAGEFVHGIELVEENDCLAFATGGDGLGRSGLIEDHLAVGRARGETLILALGTRDGWVFEAASAAAAALRVPLVDFVYFTTEEREYRAQFAEITRSIPALADNEQRDSLKAEGVSVLQEVARSADLIVVPTRYVMKQVCQIAPDVVEKTLVSYHGVDRTFDVPWSVPRDSRRGLIHVSRLSTPFAGHKNFLWSAELVPDVERELGRIEQLAFAGAGNGVGLLKAFSEARALGDEKLRILGSVSAEALATEFSRRRALLVPSMMEAGSTVVVEAVLAGCLPIAAAAGGLPEVMESLGLESYVLPTEPVLRGKIRSIEPIKRSVWNVLKKAIDEPDAVEEDMARAYELASAQYRISTTTNQLVSELFDRQLIQE